MSTSFMKLIQLKNLWDRFTANHPKIPMFGRAVIQNAVQEGTVVEITVNTAEGKNFVTNFKITAEDLELLNEAFETIRNN